MSNIIFAGVGGAFCDSSQFQSNALITSHTGKKLLLDCGTDARFSLMKLGIGNHNVKTCIDAVYISHLHSDHCGGLEWLGYCSYFNPEGSKIKLFIHKNIVDDLRTTLKAGMQIVCGQQPKRLEDFFDVRIVEVGFIWEEIPFTLFQTIHVQGDLHTMPSYGLNFRLGSTKICFTTDTQILNDKLKMLSNADLIFHDCETYEKVSGVHARYDEMVHYPEEIRQKIWLYHYHPEHQFDAKNDKFKGFVVKGQQFDF